MVADSSAGFTPSGDSLQTLGLRGLGQEPLNLKTQQKQSKRKPETIRPQCLAVGVAGVGWGEGGGGGGGGGGRSLNDGIYIYIHIHIPYTYAYTEVHVFVYI